MTSYPTVPTGHVPEGLTLGQDQAAAYCAIPVQTLCRLQKVGLFPACNVTAERLDKLLAELFANGLPWPAPTRKSQWRPFPYTQPVWTQVQGGMRLHARWRHHPLGKSIRHPFGTAGWIMVRLRTLLRTKSPRRCRPGREPIRRRGSTEPCGQLAASKTRDADWAGLRRATSVAADHRGGFTEAGAPIPFAPSGSFFHRTRSRRDVPRHAPDLPRANPRSGIHFEARSP